MTALRRAWGLPLWVHAGALVVVLVALAAIVGTDVSFSSDEGAAVLQAQMLDAGEGWTEAHPLAAVDPEGLAYYYDTVLSSGGPERFAPFAKHPLYALEVTVGLRLGGTWGMVGLSIVGAVAAAVTGALLARRLGSGLDRWTLWAVGVASPLFFDSQLVIAHAVGAALAGAGALLAIRLLDDRSWPSRLGLAAATAALLVLLLLQRTEGALFALALGGSLALLGLRRRRFDLVAFGAVFGLIGPVGNLLEHRWTRALVQSADVKVFTVIDEDLAGRISAFMSTTIVVGEAWPPIAQLGLIVSLLAGVGTPIALRRGLGGDRAILAGGLVGCAGLLLAVAGGSPDTIPGLMVACPVLVVGLLLLRRAAFGRPAAALLGLTSGLYALAVFGTQYSQGGAAEWGARYLALALPLAMPLAVSAIAVEGRRHAAAARVTGLRLLVVASVLVAGLAGWSLHYYHGNIRDWNDVMAEAIDSRTGPDLGDGVTTPVVVSTWSGLGRFLWPLEAPHRGMFVPSDRLGTYAERLHAAGVEEIVFVSTDVAKDRPAIESSYELVDTVPPGLGPDHQVWIARAR